MRLPWDPKNKPDQGSADKYQRRRSDDPYHSWRWTRLSRAFRAAHPLCAECQRHGIIKEAEVVDHIVPWPLCKDFYDERNLQSLCADCNAVKGIRDRETVFKEERKRRQGGGG